MERLPTFARPMLILWLLFPGCAQSWKTIGDADDQDEGIDAVDFSGDTGETADDGCPAGTWRCGGECVDLSSDRDNCGACGHECDAEEVCFDGECILECPAGTSPCGGTCIDIESNPANCGTCGYVCAPGETCSEGRCSVLLSGELGGLYSYEGKQVIIDATISVRPYNGTDDVTECDAGETGCLEIVAARVIVNEGAAIDAKGKGYGGGGGGGGGPGNSGGPCSDSPCSSCHPGAGGRGSAGGDGGEAGDQVDEKSISGKGGEGGGPFGGGWGDAVTRDNTDGREDGKYGGPGGYDTAGRNADTTVDESLRMGSGGGGGSGGACAHESNYSSVGGSGGGGAGNPGGGYVKIVASELIRVEGGITARGTAVSTGNGEEGDDGYYNGLLCDLSGSGGDGGDADAAGSSRGGNGVEGYFRAGWEDCIERQCENYDSGPVRGGNGGDGGTGAGGGVLLKAPSILITGTINALGGEAAGDNGGTVKIFFQGTEPPTAGISAGRIYTAEY
ncbi:MAG: hypothetical protein ABIJ56_14170 [Pseudomonadota bacterium]